MNPSDFLADELDRTRQWTVNLLEDLSSSDCSRQFNDGLQTVHWILGHLIYAENALILKRCLNRDEVNPDFIEPFKIGSVVEPPDKGALPPLENVRDEMDRIHKLATNGIRAMGPDELASPPGGGPHPMFDTRQGAVFHAARHEAFHAGQIALIRRMLGKAPLR